jgi:hypothetical protein
VGGDPGEVHAAAVVLDHDQDVEPAEEDGVDVGEVDGEDRVGLRGEELCPGRSGPQWGRIDAGAFKIVQTVEAVTQWPSPTSSPWIRRYPHVGFSRAIRSTRAWIDCEVGGGLVVVVGRSSGGRRGGRASAAGFGETPVAAGAVGWVAACSGR